MMICFIFYFNLCTQNFYYDSLVVQIFKKNVPAMQETWVRSLGQEDPLEEGMPMHQYSCLKNSTDRGPDGLYSPVGHKELDMTEHLTCSYILYFGCCLFELSSMQANAVDYSRYTFCQMPSICFLLAFNFVSTTC